MLSYKNPKGYEPRMEQNNDTELLGSSFHDIYNKNGAPDPLDTKFAIDAFPFSPLFDYLSKLLSKIKFFW